MWCCRPHYGAVLLQTVAGTAETGRDFPLGGRERVINSCALSHCHQRSRDQPNQNEAKKMRAKPKLTEIQKALELEAPRIT